MQNNKIMYDSAEFEGWKKGEARIEQKERKKEKKLKEKKSFEEDEIIVDLDSLV